MDQHTETLIIEVARRGPSGDYTGAAAMLALQGDMADLEAAVAALGLDDLGDVTITNPSTNQVLRYDGSGWINATVPSGLAQMGHAGDAGSIKSNVTSLYTQGGITVADAGANAQYIVANYGGTGTASSLSRSDHTHTLTKPKRETFGPQAYMSSGTRALDSTTVTLPAGVACVVKARLNMQMRGADPGACYYQLRLTINGNVRTSNGGSTGYWCVQGVPDKTTWEHDVQITGTGAAITVSADCIYHSGGGFYTDSGEIVVEVDTAR